MTTNTSPNVCETITLHGAEIPCVLKGDDVLVALRPIVKAIGVQWQPQHRRATADPVLRTCVTIMVTQVPGDTQAREHLFLPLSHLNGWLFGIDSRRVRPEIRDRVVAYQRDCYRVLFEHFFQKRSPMAGLNWRPPGQRRRPLGQPFPGALFYFPPDGGAAVCVDTTDRPHQGRALVIPQERGGALKVADLVLGPDLNFMPWSDGKGYIAVSSPGYATAAFRRVTVIGRVFEATETPSKISI